MTVRQQVDPIRSRVPIVLQDGSPNDDFARKFNALLGNDLDTKDSKQDADPDLTSIAALAGTGIAVRTGQDAWALRTVVAPAAGLSVTNPAGTAGDITLGLANDLAALEALSGTNTIYYRSASDTWTAVTIGSALSFSGGTLDRAALTGDVTASAGSNTTTIANDAVTNAKAANMATATFKGRVTAGTGDPEDLTGTQATTLLDVFTSGLKGLAPASGGGTSNFLRADGTWAAPSGGASITVKDEGSSLTTALTSMDFVGAGVTATNVAGAVTVTIAAGSYTDEQAQDAVGAMVDSSLTYVDATPLLQRAALTGDVTAPAGSNSTTIANDAVTYAKMQNVSATDKLLGRSTAGSGDVEEIACTGAGRALIDDASAAAQRTTLGLLRCIAAFFTTTPTASEVLGIYIAADDFTLAANLSGSQVSVGTNPTATFAIDIQKNGSTIATISISTGGVATLTTVGGTSKTIVAGDIIKFVAPTPADATIANVAWNLKGTL